MVRGKNEERVKYKSFAKHNPFLPGFLFLDASLINNERQCRQVSESIQDVIYASDEQRKITFISGAVEKYLGITADALSGKPLLESMGSAHIPSEIISQIREKFKQILHNNEKSVVYEFPLKRNGKTNYFECRENIHYDKSGNFTGSSGVMRDITKRKIIEKELTEKNQQLNTLFSNLPGMAYRCMNNRDWTMIFLSDGCKHLTGYTSQDLIDDRVISYGNTINPNDKENVWNEVQQTLKQKKPFKTTYRILTADGDEKWVWEQGRGIFNPQGELKYLEGFITDITKQIHAEGEAEQYIDELQIISETIVKISRMHDVDEICQLIAEQIHILDEKIIVAVSFYNPEKKGITIRSIEGLGEQYANQVFKLFNKSPSKLVIPPENMGETAVLFTTGKLEQVPGGLYDLMAGTLPRIACNAAEKMLDITTTYTVGFALGDQPRGGISFFVPRGQKLRYISAIEGIASFASMVLHRLLAEEKSTFLREYSNKILESVPDSIIMLKGDQIEYVNNAFLSTFGKSRDECISKDLTKIVPNEISSFFQDIRQDTGKKKEVEIDGKNFIVSSFMVKKAEEEVRWAILFQDTSEQKKASKRIEHLNQVLASIRNVNQLITKGENRDRLIQKTCEILTEKRGHYNAWIVLFNHKGTYLTSAETGLAKRFTPMKEQLKLNNWPFCVKNALDQEGILVIENPKKQCINCPLSSNYVNRGAYTIKLAYDQIVYGLLSVSIPHAFIHDKDEQHLFSELAGDIGFALHNLEIETKRKQTEKDLKKSENRFRDITNTMAECVWEIDKDARYTFVSKRVESLLGWKSKEMMGKKPFDLMPREEAQRVAKQFEKIISEKKPIKDLENWNLTKKGRKICLLTNGKPILNETGDFIGYRGIDKDITERKNMEKSLRKAIEFQEKIFNSLKDGFTLWNREGAHINVNPAFCKMTGFKQEELIGTKPPHPYWSEKDLEKIQQAFKETIAGEFKDFKMKFKRKNGEYFPVIVSPSQITDEKGTPLYYFATIKDISEEEKRKEEIRKSEKKYHTLFETMAQGVIYQDADGKIISANKAAERILGLTFDQMERRDPRDLRWKAVDRDRNELPIDKHPAMVALRTGKKVTDFQQGIFNPKKNKYLWIIVNSVPQYKKGSDTPYQVYSTFLDITNRIEGEEKLKEKEKQLDLALKGGELGTWDWNIQTNEVRFNKRWVEMKGYNHEELKPHLSTGEYLIHPNDLSKTKQSLPHLSTWGHLIHPNDLSKTKQSLNDHLEGKTPSYEAEFRMKHKSGRWIWILDKGKVIERDDQGIPLRACGTHMDITKRKQAEKKMEQGLYILKKREKELEMINEHLDSFAYSVSHDLRAPLRAVNGFAQVLIDSYGDKVNEEMHHYLNRISEGGKRMGELIDALLNFSRTTRAEITYETVDVKHIVDDLVKTYDESEADRDIEFLIHPLDNIEADEEMVKVVFNNLISNAVKYTIDREKAQIEIGCNQQKNMVEFFVKDNGIGFDMRYQDKLFKAFQRLKTDERFTGSGIGLVTAKRIVTKHGGTIWAEGEVDKGATFYFSLPSEKESEIEKNE
ncbi:MAG: PAS domain S-box protein [Thermoplasmatota archaeon]